MHRDFMPELARMRQEEYRAEAERRRYRKRAVGRTRVSWRARVARGLFDAAFALEAEESWRAMWDRMSGERRGRLFRRKCAR